MVPVIGQDQLQLGPEGIGILASMDGIGAFCGRGSDGDVLPSHVLSHAPMSEG